MLSVVSLVVGQLQTNCYLVFDQITKETAIIDPGDDFDYISQKLNFFGLLPKYILATHGHFDHLLAVPALKLIFSIPFLVPKDDEFLVRRAAESARYFLNLEFKERIIVDNYLEDVKEIKLGHFALEVLPTPGHTPGSVTFIGREEKILFTGDLFFADGSYGRTDFSYANLAHLKDSIQKVLSFKESFAIYPGHGEKFDVKKAINIFSSHY